MRKLKIIENATNQWKTKILNKNFFEKNLKKVIFFVINWKKIPITTTSTTMRVLRYPHRYSILVVLVIFCNLFLGTSSEPSSPDAADKSAVSSSSSASSSSSSSSSITEHTSSFSSASSSSPADENDDEEVNNNNNNNNVLIEDVRELLDKEEADEEDEMKMKKKKKSKESSSASVVEEVTNKFEEDEENSSNRVEIKTVPPPKIDYLVNTKGKLTHSQRYTNPVNPVKRQTLTL